jgi:cysteine synthase A
MNINSPVLSRIGDTPIMRIFKDHDDIAVTKRNIYSKIESGNAGFSVKDRIAYYMIKTAIADKKINSETVVIEPTSGNTGIGLALVCAALKIKIKLVMPDTMSVERRCMIKHLGAEIILTDGAKGMRGAIDTAREIVSERPDKYFMPQQFENPANPEAHRRGTAPEFLKFINLYSIKPDALVFGVGTGGTLTGVSEVIKQYYPDVIICAVEPEASPVLSGGAPGAHKIQGIGAGFIPKILNTSIINKIIKINNETAFQYCRLLAQREGVLAGISSGAAAAASCELSTQLPEGSNIFTLFPDSAERYLSMLQ